jgi:hypothetical protein
LIANSFEFAFIVPIEKQQGLGDKWQMNVNKTLFCTGNSLSENSAHLQNTVER